MCNLEGYTSLGLTVISQTSHRACRIAQNRALFSLERRYFEVWHGGVPNLRLFSPCSIDLIEKTKPNFYRYNGYFDAIKDLDTAQVRKVEQLS